MSSAARADRPAVAALQVYQPPQAELQRARWRINGFLASIIVWTADEWSRLEHRPNDAQYLPCGVWCALRIEE